MKVIYELELDDVKQLIAEKYGVKPEKISFPYAGTSMYWRIDMSDIESWEPVRKPDPEPRKEVVKYDELPADKYIDDIPTLKYIEPEEPAPAPERVISTDYDLTDEEIKNFIRDNISVAELCRRYGFDKKAQYRLYKRFEKARLESAS